MQIENIYLILIVRYPTSLDKTIMILGSIAAF